MEAPIPEEFDDERDVSGRSRDKFKKERDEDEGEKLAKIHR